MSFRGGSRGILIAELFGRRRFLASLEMTKAALQGMIWQARWGLIQNLLGRFAGDFVVAHVFAYGSLMIPAVMRAVTGCDFLSISASLQDYARYRVRGESYPGIVPEKGALTRGILYLNVDCSSVERLDDFEGEWYVRTPVKIKTPAGRLLPAEAYVFEEKHRNLLSSVGWDIKTFEIKHLKAFLQNYKGFRTSQKKG